MDLKPEAIQEFAEIWRKEFGEELSFEQARMEAESLLSLVELLAAPDKPDPPIP